MEEKMTSTRYLAAKCLRSYGVGGKVFSGLGFRV